jgi:DNA polymerase-3 subunit epsilon
LRRPIAIVDLETTGVAVETDRIVEIAVLRISPDGSKVRYVKRINPGIPIPPEATQVHGIGDEEVRNEPRFSELADKLVQFLDDCDIGGFNVAAFDLRILQSEFARAGVEFSVEGRAIIDVQRIYHMREPRDLSAAARFYLDAEHEGAHSALEDVRITWGILQAQLERYADLPREVAALHDACKPPADRYVDAERRFEWRHRKAAFAFGKHRGRLLEEVAEEDPEYLEWMCAKDFSPEIKHIVRKALEGVFPQPPGEDEE